MPFCRTIQGRLTTASNLRIKQRAKENPMSAKSPTENPTKNDPRDRHEKPPFEERKQAPPGHETEMRSKPDHGEQTYRGFDRLRGKAALITGGDSGIGRAVAIAYAREGADVAISYLPQEQRDAEETKGAVTAEGRRCALIPGDLTDANFCRELVEQTVRQLGKLDV